MSYVPIKALQSKDKDTILSPYDWQGVSESMKEGQIMMVAEMFEPLEVKIPYGTEGTHYYLATMIADQAGTSGTNSTAAPH